MKGAAQSLHRPAADAYTALLLHAPAGEGPGIAAVPPADRSAGHASRAAALMRRHCHIERYSNLQGCD